MTKRLRVLGWPAFKNRHEQPFTSLLYEHMPADVAEASTARIASGTYDILHLHWPDRRVRHKSAVTAAARSAALITAIDLAHARGMKVVWTVHNLSAHEGVRREWLEERYWDAFTHRIDAFISMSDSGVSAVRERHPRLKQTAAFVIPHGHYRGVYPDDLDKSAARGNLGFTDNARVIAFVGQIRVYKNVPQLIEAFKNLSDDSAVLSIAGKPRPDALHRSIEDAATRDKRIQLDARFIPDDELQVYLRAADLVVLPYREILNSGSALLALSFDRPVLVPDKGAMADLADSIGHDWVRTYTGDLTANVLQESLRWATAAGRPTAPELTGLDWHSVAKRTAEAFAEITRSGQQHTHQVR